MSACEPQTARRCGALLPLVMLVCLSIPLGCGKSDDDFTPAGRAEPAPGGERQRTVKVAAVQFASGMGKPKANRERLAACVRKAASNGAKIVVLPETAIHGYMSPDLLTTWQADGRQLTDGLKGMAPDDVAESVPGPSTRIFAALAREHHIYLTVPILEAEPDTGRFFNTLVLAGPDGELLLHYRKLNPWPFAERGWASKGDRGHQYVDTPYGRLAVLICYDINFEPPRLKQQNVDILLYSIAWVDRPGSDWFSVRLPRIARRNDLNIVGANWTVPQEPDWHGYGQTLIIDRAGHVLASADRDVGEEIVYAELPIPAQGTE